MVKNELFVDPLVCGTDSRLKGGGCRKASKRLHDSLGEDGWWLD